MLSFLNSFFQFSKKEKDWSFGLMQQYEVDKLMKEQRWQEIEALVKNLSSDELSRFVDGICLTTKFSKEIKYYISTDNELSRLISGAWHLHLAWLSRTRKLGKDLSTSEVDGFTGYLKLAEKYLNTYFSTSAFRSESQARMVRVWMGFNEADNAIFSFNESVAEDKNKFWAYHHLFKVLSPKWLGNKEDLRSYIDSIKIYNIHYALQTMYLVEIFSDYYYNSKGKIQEIWYNENKDIIYSIINHEPIPVENTLLSIYANNNLVYLYHLLGEEEKRNQLFDQLNGLMTPYPWDYFGIESESDKSNFRKSAAYPRP